MKGFFGKIAALAVFVGISAGHAQADCSNSIAKHASKIRSVMQSLSDNSCEYRIIKSCEQVSPANHKIISYQVSPSCNGWSKTTSREVDIYVNNSDSPNAIANLTQDNKGIVILSEGLLKEIDNADQLAFVLAHELAHIQHSHVREQIPAMLLTASQLHRISAIHKQWEIDADTEAIIQITKAGYKAKKALTLLGKLSRYENPHSHSHPSTHHRLAHINH